MAVSNVIAYFIMLTTGATLHVNGKTHVDTAAQAAEALRPIAGPFAYALFGAGIIGTGMLALPVLAGSIGYSISELFRWPVGLNKELCKAKHFYAIISGAMLLGFVMDFIGLNPLAALFWSAVMNGIVAAPIMVFIMIMSQNRKIMENFTPNPSLRINGWIATTIMGAGAVGLLLTAGR
jgi:Mn2+/Fe2+ NRAMP family transporter